MSHGSLIKGLLLSTLVWTVPINVDQKALSQAESKQVDSIIDRSQNRKHYQELLQKLDTLQVEAANYRKAVDTINFQILEKDSRNFKLVLVGSRNFNRVFNKFIQEIEDSQEIYSLQETKQILDILKRDSLDLKAFISDLETLDENTLDKFILDSTKIVRNLELQVSQIENIVYRQLLGLPTTANFTRDVLNDSVAEKDRISEVAKVNSSSRGSFNFKILLILAILSSLTIVIIAIAYKQNKYFRQIGNKDRYANKQTSKYSNVEQKRHLDSVNQNRVGIPSFASNYENHQSQSNNPKPHYQKVIQPSFSINQSQAIAPLLPKTPAPSTFQSTHSVTYISSKEALVTAFTLHPKTLAKKVIKVAVTKESIEHTRSGVKTAILFTETGNDNYWIALEPELEANHYFLIPKPNLIVSSRIYQTVEDIFDCPGYQNRTSNKFQLKLPAVVQFDGSGYWKLVKPGELIFS